MIQSQVWAIVLAAGNGSRMRDLALDEAGERVPKQFWKLDGGRSLLRATLDRIRPLIRLERTVPIVAASHAHWWTQELADVPGTNVVVQPANRGTAAGILLPLLRVLSRDREAVVLVLPSDHWVEDEDVLRGAVVDALDHARRRRDRVVLLGMLPDRCDLEYGWIVPERGRRDAALAVATFVEKPDAKRASALLQRGAVVNSLILAAKGACLLHLFDLALPQLVGEMVSQQRGCDGRSLEELYETLSVRDFSRHVLEPFPHLLSVLRAPACGWTDVGVPHRVVQLLAGPRKPPRAWSPAVGSLAAPPAAATGPIRAGGEVGG